MHAFHWEGISKIIKRGISKLNDTASFLIRSACRQAFKLVDYHVILFFKLKFKE